MLRESHTRAGVSVRIGEALLDIVVALALFLLAAVLVGSVAGIVPAPMRAPAVVFLQGALLIVVVAILLVRRGQSWRHIGLIAPRLADVPRGILAFVACFGLNMVLVYGLSTVSPEIVEAHSERLGMIARQLTSGVSLAGLLVMLAFVGVYEELFARGLLLQRCRVVLGGTWLPVLASSLLFGLGHLYQGWMGVAQTTLIGIVLAVLTLRWGTLWPAIIAHALLDIVSVMFLRSMAQ